MSPEVFGMLLLLAQEAYEHSWDGAKYVITHDDAARHVCRSQQWDLKWSRPIGFLNEMAWNDAQMWAREVTGG